MDKGRVQETLQRGFELGEIQGVILLVKPKALDEECWVCPKGGVLAVVGNDSLAA